MNGDYIIYVEVKCMGLVVYQTILYRIYHLPYDLNCQLEFLHIPINCSFSKSEYLTSA